MTQQQILTKVDATLWGKPQNQRRLAIGVFEVDTASHGGIMVLRSVAPKLLSQGAITRGQIWEKWLCYEKNCNWALVIYEHPEYHTSSREGSITQARQAAFVSLHTWHRDYLDELRQVEILGTKWFCNGTIGIVATKGGANDWAAYLGHGDPRGWSSPQILQYVARHGQKLYEHEARGHFQTIDLPYRGDGGH